MRINEVITEASIGTIFTNDLKIIVDQHAIDRAKERGVSPHAVDYIIKKQLPKVLRKLQLIPSGQKIWVYDWSSETALGLRRISDDKLIFQLKTVWPGVPSLTPGSDLLIKI